MQHSNRHNKILNGMLAAVAAPILRGIFRFSYEKHKLDGPTLVISNHVTNYDPLLVSICFPRDHMHFVSSEHLFRLGWISKFLRYVFDPIPRRKGTSGADTAMACTRKLRDGRSVCLFAEGECSWDGVTQEIFPATGRLARMGNATLITFRLEGGYLTAPRWGKGIRKGRMHGRIVGIYSPEELKAMDKNAITALIQRDVFEDTWQQQKTAPVSYRSRRRAENLHVVLWACPHCHGVGTLRGKGNFLSCTCGKQWEFTEFGSFAPAEPFENIAQWDAWQTEFLTQQAQTLSFTDPRVTMLELEDGHRQTVIAQGELVLENGILRCGEEAIPLGDIDDMALVQSRMLLLSAGSRYCQLKAKDPCCLRKYYTLWKHNATTATPSAATGGTYL